MQDKNFTGFVCVFDGRMSRDLRQRGGFTAVTTDVDAHRGFL